MAEPATLRAELARQVGPRKAEEMLTTAEKLRREGEARGVVRGKREMLLRQLRLRFSRIPAATRVRIEAATTDELDAWSSRVLTATSLGEVLEVTAAAPPSEATPPARAPRRNTRRRTSG